MGEARRRSYRFSTAVAITPWYRESEKKRTNRLRSPRYGVGVSSLTLLGIVLVVVSVVTAAIFMGMLLWAAREDGRDQRRIDARIERMNRRRPGSS